MVSGSGPYRCRRTNSASASSARGLRARRDDSVVGDGIRENTVRRTALLELRDQRKRLVSAGSLLASRDGCGVDDSVRRDRFIRSRIPILLQRLQAGPGALIIIPEVPYASGRHPQHVIGTNFAPVEPPDDRFVRRCAGVVLTATVSPPSATLESDTRCVRPSCPFKLCSIEDIQEPAGIRLEELTGSTTGGIEIVATGGRDTVSRVVETGIVLRRRSQFNLSRTATPKARHTIPCDIALARTIQDNYRYNFASILRHSPHGLLTYVRTVPQQD
ncbi:hypothetical protein LMG29542_07328 [Paraburkholderia humisilvae]|uniref:Uncharacterized protein n=1 Tax=Paraburkholderia humisilvae TaxID=627669 RepID=A0A6J5F518_9BURK|nr:hypothetical protein LMG29542_07328 [Paraburkholderia humisilvae]